MMTIELLPDHRYITDRHSLDADRQASARVVAGMRVSVAVPAPIRSGMHTGSPLRSKGPHRG